ncbi:unnamed protein product [Nesidiocoris tenuis]|uniref:Uncharacterized protein n=1 Tax=Nesidiocoris tenuis TaxID=355587 RepID=A0A6H5HWV3_9HEMI|nr:unnamed protein product [Nesidiocoris tenuis]
MDVLVSALGHHIKSKLSMKLEDIFSMSLPKLSSQDDDGPTSQGHQYSGVVNFEPIPHDHDFCERVVINAHTAPSFNFNLN